MGEKIGLAAKGLKSAFDNLSYLRKIRADDQEARRNGIIGIPTVIINGRLALGAQSYEDLKYFITRWGDR